MVCKYSLLLCRLSLDFADCFFCCAEAFKIGVVPLVNFCFVVCALGIISKKSLLRPMLRSFFSRFSSSCFTISGLMFKSSIHFKLVFVIGIRQGCNFILLHVVIQFSQHHLLKRLSTLGVLSTLVKYQFSVYVRVAFWSLYSIPFYFYASITRALQCSLISGSMMPLALFFLMIALAIWSLLWFHTNFKFLKNISVKNAIGTLKRIALNIQMALGSMDILIILILLIHEHRILSICLSSLVSFNKILQFLLYRSFPSLVKFYSQVFYFF